MTFKLQTSRNYAALYLRIRNTDKKGYRINDIYAYRAYKFKKQLKILCLPKEHRMILTIAPTLLHFLAQNAMLLSLLEERWVL